MSKAESSGGRLPIPALDSAHNSHVCGTHTHTLHIHIIHTPKGEMKKCRNILVTDHKTELTKLTDLLGRRALENEQLEINPGAGP